MTLSCRSEHSDLPVAKIEDPHSFGGCGWMRNMPGHAVDEAIEAIQNLKALGLDIRLRQVDTRYE